VEIVVNLKKCGDSLGKKCDDKVSSYAETLSYFTLIAYNLIHGIFPNLYNTHTQI